MTATFTVGGNWIYNGDVTVNGILNINNWINVTNTSQLMQAGASYIANNAALVTFQLPVSANIGDTFLVKGNGAGGWLIQANAAQTIILEELSSSVAGSISSTASHNGVLLVCTATNVTFSSLWFSGTLDAN